MNWNKRAVIAIAAAALSATCADSAIMSGEERAAKLAAAKDLVDNQVRPVEGELLAKAPDPFAPDLGLAKVETKAIAASLSDAELLPILAKSINPTGVFAISGENYLIFKERKVKAGAQLSVLYNGTEYNVTVTDITGVSYTVALGNSELQLKLK